MQLEQLLLLSVVLAMLALVLSLLFGTRTSARPSPKQARKARAEARKRREQARETASLPEGIVDLTQESRLTVPPPDIKRIEAIPTRNG